MWNPFKQKSTIDYIAQSIRLLEEFRINYANIEGKDSSVFKEYIISLKEKDRYPYGLSKNINVDDMNNIKNSFKLLSYYYERLANILLKIQQLIMKLRISSEDEMSKHFLGVSIRLLNSLQSHIQTLQSINIIMKAGIKRDSDPSSILRNLGDINLKSSTDEYQEHYVRGYYREKELIIGQIITEETLKYLRQLLDIDTKYVSWLDFVKSKVKYLDNYVAHDTNLPGFELIIRNSISNAVTRYCWKPDSTGNLKNHNWRHSYLDLQKELIDDFSIEIAYQLQQDIIKNNFMKEEGPIGVENHTNIKILSDAEFRYISDHPIKTNEDIRKQDLNTMRIIKEAFRRINSFKSSPSDERNLLSATIGILIKEYFIGTNWIRNSTHPNQCGGLFSADNIIGVVLYNSRQVNKEMVKQIMLKEYYNNLPYCVPIYTTDLKMLWPE